MKYRILPLGLLLSAQLLAGDDWSLNNHWSFYGDFVYMERTELHSKTIVREKHFSSTSNSFYTKPELNTGHLMHNFDWEPGFRAGIIFMQRRYSLEGSFLFLNEWHSKSKVKGVSEKLSYPFKKDSNPQVQLAFSLADRAWGEYKSQFWTADLNYWRHVTPRRMDYFSFSWLAGLRYVQLDEKSEVHFKKRLSREKSEYSIETKNYLPGPQVGLNIQVNPYRQWSWDFTGKIGGLVDYHQQDVSVKNNVEKFRGGKDRDFSIALFIDLSVMLSWNVWKHASFHVGYEMFYLSGVALAPERFKRTTSNHAIKHAEAHGQVLIDGAFGGLALSF
ncbi:MAG: BBP7 family outer membrane beta-barrel protein [Chlamydiota bacterium]